MTEMSFVYILTNESQSVLYTGVTSDLLKRTWQHKQGVTKGFAERYHATRLVYFEVFEDIRLAIGREKQIKAGSRRKKLDLINAMNPNWDDLSKTL
jgi:putative endonuclease